MASAEDDSKQQSILQTQNSLDNQQQSIDKSSGVPLGDFVLQLEDYSPTVSSRSRSSTVVAKELPERIKKDLPKKLD